MKLVAKSRDVSISAEVRLPIIYIGSDAPRITMHVFFSKVIYKYCIRTRYCLVRMHTPRKVAAYQMKHLQPITCKLKRDVLYYCCSVQYVVLVAAWCGHSLCTRTYYYNRSFASLCCRRRWIRLGLLMGWV